MMGQIAAPRTTHYSRNFDVIVVMLRAMRLVSLLNNLARETSDQDYGQAFENRVGIAGRNSPNKLCK